MDYPGKLLKILTFDIPIINIHWPFIKNSYGASRGVAVPSAKSWLGYVASLRPKRLAYCRHVYAVTNDEYQFLKTQLSFGLTRIR